LQQNIVFSNLADSSCNPADFQCACNQLVALGVTGKVSSACSAADTTEYVEFQRNICANIQPVAPVSTPSSTSSATSVIVTPTTTPASTDLPSFSLESVTPTPEVISSTTTEIPYINSTSTVTETTAVVTSDSVGTVGPVPTTSALLLISWVLRRRLAASRLLRLLVRWVLWVSYLLSCRNGYLSY
jgi:hypothetical protein